MKTKRGISLVMLVLTIIVMVILTTITIVGINNALLEASKDDFVVELATIKDKVKEHYLTMGTLPVKAGEQYTANELVARHTNDTYKTILTDEITANKDNTNTFCVVDLERLQITTTERGLEKDSVDIFVVASNTLNIYYLKGVEIGDFIYFSTAMLAPQNQIEVEQGENATDVTLNEEISITKNTNVWTNEIVLKINNKLDITETLLYSIAGSTAKSVAADNIITINSSNMTSEEITALTNNKTVTITKVDNGTAIATKEISISNLDIVSPTLTVMEMADTSNENYNVIKLNSTDSGNSGVKAIYYDIDTVLKDSTRVSYYTNRSEVKSLDLMNFGKISKDGVIKLEKNVKSIVAIAVDNAGNISDIVTYTLEDAYLISK